MTIQADIAKLLEMYAAVADMAARYQADLACIEWDRNSPLVNAVSVLGGEASGLKQAAGWLQAVEQERNK